jgi:heat shock protein HtpX
VSAEEIEYVQPRTGISGRFACGYLAALFAMLALWSAAVSAPHHPVLGALAAVVWVQLAVLMFRQLRVAGGLAADDAAAARITPIVRDLSERMDIGPIRVLLRSDAMRPAAVFSRGGSTRLVLSLPYLRRIDDTELRALLAHEFSHLTGDDMRVAKRRALATLLAAAVWAALAALVVRDSVDNAPIVAAVWMLAFFLSFAVVARSNHPREFRADEAAAKITGEPAAMATALSTAQEMAAAEREKIVGTPPWQWLLLPFSLRLPTHPPVAERIARLREMAAAR